MTRRSAPLPSGWQRTIRPRILARDRHRCTRCGAPATDVDHVIPAIDGGTDDDTNLTSLCGDCHRSKTGREARRSQRERRRPAERHPGLID